MKIVFLHSIYEFIDLIKESLINIVQRVQESLYFGNKKVHYL